MEKKYQILKIREVGQSFSSPKFWEKVPALSINNYLWMNNNYKPNVKVKICYSNDYLFAYFSVKEKEITATYSEINDPVYIDSCVEFFVNLFPTQTNKYFNIEINAIGTIYVAFGAVGKRSVLKKSEIEEIQISSTYTKPIIGLHGKDNWEIKYKFPISLFEKYYKKVFEGGFAKGNFYKCGDNTKFEHYGAWNNVTSENPNFHLPKYFGDLQFSKT